MLGLIYKCVLVYFQILGTAFINFSYEEKDNEGI